MYRHNETLFRQQTHTHTHTHTHSHLPTRQQAHIVTCLQDSRRVAGQATNTHTHSHLPTRLKTGRRSGNKHTQSPAYQTRDESPVRQQTHTHTQSPAYQTRDESPVRQQTHTHTVTCYQTRDESPVRQQTHTHSHLLTRLETKLETSRWSGNKHTHIPENQTDIMCTQSYN